MNEAATNVSMDHLSGDTDLVEWYLVFRTRFLRRLSRGAADA